jgi:hypothetical protein
MTQDFIFAQDVILDPGTGKIVAVVRNGEPIDHAEKLIGTS